MGTKITSDLSGDQLDDHFVRFIANQDSDNPVLVKPAGDQFYAFRGGFDGMYGDTPKEAIKRFVLWEAFGDSIDLP
jgi:hypothetical protein